MNDLLKLYKEVAQKSPSKGQLPFSTDWFIGWQPNIHSSLFLNIYEYLQKTADIDSIDAITKAYRLYLHKLTVAASNRCSVLRAPGVWSVLLIRTCFA